MSGAHHHHAEKKSFLDYLLPCCKKPIAHKHGGDHDHKNEHEEEEDHKHVNEDLVKQNHDHNDDGNILNKFTFSEDNFLYRIFFLMKIFSVIATAYIYPYMAAFRKQNLWDTNVDESVQGGYLMPLSNVFETIFLIDLVLNFFKQYKSEYDYDHP